MTPRTRAVRFVAAAAGAFHAAFGLWAFVHPTSFFERIAAFPPYNQHLLHDIGAFQTGVGAALIIALVRSDALLAVLAGTGVGAALHTLSHVIDRDLGGRATDPLSLGLLAAVLIVAAVTRSRGGEAPADDASAAQAD